MRRSTMLAACCGVATLLVIGGGVSLAFQKPAAVSDAAQPALSIDEVNSLLSLRDSRLVTLAVPDLEEAGDEFDVSLPIDDVMVTLALRKHSVRDPNYTVQVQLPDGSMQVVPPSPVNTFVGTIVGMDGATVAAAIEPAGLFVNLTLPDGSRRVVQPLSEHISQAQPSDYVVFRGEDIIGGGGVCGVDPDMAPNHDPSIELIGDCGGLCVAQIAVDCDFEYYVSRGSNVTNVQARVNQLINTLMNADAQLYAAVGIRHDIVAIIVRSSEPDPYTSTNSTTLLNQFRTHWINNQGAIVRDVAILFTGKEVDGSVIGQAFTIGGICTTSGYCMAQVECCGSNACAYDLIAHELGHLWGCNHISDGNTMNPSITCATNFSTTSRNEIIAHRNTRTCLSPPAAPGGFNLMSPANGATGVALMPTFDWSDSSSVESYQFTLDDDPAFATPVADVAVATSTFTPTTSLVPGRQYHWKVVASNGFSSTNSTPTVATFTTIRDCNNNGIDDGIELQNPANDCNENGILDGCDISGAYTNATADIVDLFSPNVLNTPMMGTPAAVSDVFLKIRARGDLNIGSEFIDIQVNGILLAQAFTTTGQDCTLVEDNEIIPGAAFNAARAGNPDITITFIPSLSVANNCTPPFTTTWVSAQLDYVGTPNSADTNSNNIPDECEGPTFPPGDMNCDGIVSVSDIGPFVLALTDPTGYAAAFPACDINNADVNGDTTVSVSDIGPFVALLN